MAFSLAAIATSVLVGAGTSLLKKGVSSALGGSKKAAPSRGPSVAPSGGLMSPVSGNVGGVGVGTSGGEITALESSAAGLPQVASASNVGDDPAEFAAKLRESLRDE